MAHLDKLFLELNTALQQKISKTSTCISKINGITRKIFKRLQEPSLTVYGVGTLTMSFGMDISKAKKLWLRA